jgi:dipeptidase
MKIKYILLLSAMFLIYGRTFPCTNLLVTKGASKDGSAFLVYTNDGEWLYRLDHSPAMDHNPADSLEFVSRYGVKGKISQVPHTYGIIGFQMNEHQLAIGETTFTGREELWNKSKYLEYWHLMKLALERAKNAREAIEVMTGLVEKYGYGSEGESFSIVDPEEAWILEMIGTGTGGDGAIWVAVRIPDGYISAHANMSRIGTFPLDDPDNCLYSKNVISFAIEHNYYNPKSGEPFRFNTAYCPPSPEKLKYSESRVWSLFRRAAPSLQLSTDYMRGVKGADRYPLWIKPDTKLSLKDVMSLVRDHYEGTPFDMTKGLAAGPYGNPNRWRPLQWELDSMQYSWERPVSTYNTAFSYIGQMRSWLPDDIGGVCWFGEDDTYFTCYTPFYAITDSIPEPFTKGDLNKFSRGSAFWIFNAVSNYANIRYSDMTKDIRKVQEEIESEFIEKQDSVEAIAMKLEGDARRKYLTDYSVNSGEMVFERWTELWEALMTKYNDGYIKDEKGRIREEGYPIDWQRKVLKEEGDKMQIKPWK